MSVSSMTMTGDKKVVYVLFQDGSRTLDSFLKTGAISRLQYDKSYGDLVKKMGMESVAEKLEKDLEEKR